MHEFSIALDIIQIAGQALKKEGGSTITHIEMDAGLFSGVDKEALEIALQQAAKSTPAENCRITIHVITGLLLCRDCNKTFTDEIIYSPCPYCHSTNTLIKKGMELKVKSIEIE